MLENLPVNVQVYLFSVALGVAAPLTVFWMLRAPLAVFLASIFRDAGIERFWMRVVLLVLFCGAFSVAIGFVPARDAAQDMVVLVWNLADQVQSILESLLWSMLGLFLPLLLSYTILNVGRDRGGSIYPRRESS